MSEARITVLTDRDKPNGGGAIIRITGIGLVPPGSLFRIEAIDSEIDAEHQAGWPSGELKPLGMRIREDGVDLLVGPEVVDSPALLPGTPVAISVPAVDVRTELLWPSLPMSKREPRRGAVVMSGEQRAADLAARAAAAAKAEAEAKAAAAAKADAEAKAEAARHAAAALEADRAHARSVPTEVSAREALARARQPAESLSAGLSQLSLSPDRRAATVGARDGSRGGVHPPMPTPGRADGSGLAPPVAPQPAPVKPMAGRVGQEPRGTAPEPRGPEARPAPASVRTAAARPTPTQPPPPQARRSLAASVVPFVLGGMVALGGYAGWSALNRKSPAADTTTTMTTAAIEVSNSAPGRTGAFAVPRLAGILDVPDRSPLGHEAKGADLAEALRRADSGLHSARGSGERGEAKFWLRKALALGLGDARLQWAVTQLGTLYAQPDAGEPDYQSARVLWELAAAQGDAVSYCFLASLHEHGLGVAKDVKKALGLLREAKQRGGCRNIDEKIARIEKGGRP